MVGDTPAWLDWVGTPPKFNSDRPEKWWLEDDPASFWGPAYFRGYVLNFHVISKLFRDFFKYTKMNHEKSYWQVLNPHLVAHLLVI